MAVRIRKLAKELQSTPTQVLRTLEELGFQRYRSPEDMLPEGMVAKVRQAWKDRSPAAAPRPQASAGTNHAPSPPADDPMAQLVPGVVPQPKKASSLLAARERKLEMERARSQAERRALEQERAELEAKRQAQQAELAQAHERVQALEEAREGWIAERERLGQARDALEKELSEVRAALDDAHQRNQALASELEKAGPAGMGGADSGLTKQLAKRGLRVRREQEAALAALAAAGHLGPVMGTLYCSDPKRVGELLASRLALVGGEADPPVVGGMVAVEVAPERAELPAPAELARMVTRVSELLMLHGLRRVLVVGGTSVGQRILRELLDTRLEVRFSSATKRDASKARADVAKADAVFLWNVELEAEARARYDASRVVAVEVPEPTFPAMRDAVERVLTED